MRKDEKTHIFRSIEVVESTIKRPKSKKDKYEHKKLEKIQIEKLEKLGEYKQANALKWITTIK